MDPMNPITGNPFVGMNANPLYYLDPDGRCSSPTLCSLGYGFAYAKNDAERTGVFEGALNETPSLGRTYGALKGASHLVMAPANVGTDAVDAMFGDTQARTRTAQRLVALSQESEANSRSLVLGPSGPTYRLTAMFVGGVATHAGEMSEAIEQRNYVGQGQAGFDLGMDTLVVAGGASIGVSALRATSMGRTVGSGISSVELPLAQQAEIAAAQDAKMMQIATGPAVVAEGGQGAVMVVETQGQKFYSTLYQEANMLHDKDPDFFPVAEDSSTRIPSAVEIEDARILYDRTSNAGTISKGHHRLGLSFGGPPINPANIQFTGESTIQASKLTGLDLSFYDLYGKTNAKVLKIYQPKPGGIYIFGNNPRHTAATNFQNKVIRVQKKTGQRQ